jgi:hypothetical protein
MDKHRRYNVQQRQRTKTGHTIDKKDKEQTPARQWTRKTKDKHRPYNIQKRKRTKTGHTIDKKDNGQTPAIQYTKKTKDKHRQQNEQTRQTTFVHCIACACSLSFLSILLPVFVL